jgi:hypothetical protein
VSERLPPGTRIEPCSWMTTGLEGKPVKAVKVGDVLYAAPADVFRLCMGDDVEVLVLPEFNPFAPLPTTMKPPEPPEFRFR